MRSCQARRALRSFEKPNNSVVQCSKGLNTPAFCAGVILGGKQAG
jgi:hypothetical protein